MIRQEKKKKERRRKQRKKEILRGSLSALSILPTLRHQIVVLISSQGILPSLVMKFNKL